MFVDTCQTLIIDGPVQTFLITVFPLCKNSNPQYFFCRQATLIPSKLMLQLLVAVHYLALSFLTSKYV